MEKLQKRHKQYRLIYLLAYIGSIVMFGASIPLVNNNATIGLGSIMLIFAVPGALICGIVFSLRARNLRRQMARYQKYLMLIGNENSVALDDLAVTTGSSYPRLTSVSVR